MKIDNHPNNDILSLPIWYNTNIKIGGQTVFYKQWYENKVIHISDLINTDNNFYNYVDFQEKYDIKTNFLTYYAIITSVKNILKNIKEEDYTNFIYYPKLPAHLSVFFHNTKGARHMYKTKWIMPITPIAPFVTTK